MLPTPEPALPADGVTGVVWSTKKGEPDAGLMAATAKFDARKGLVELEDPSSKTLFEKGVPTDAGSDGVIAWGRWTDGKSKVRGDDGDAKGDIAALHYFTASATPGGATSGRFTSIASTSPTVVSNGKLVSTGSVNSASGSFTATLVLNLSGSASYTLTVPVPGQTFSLVGEAKQTSPSTFAGVSVIKSTGTACAGGCTGSLGGNISVIGQIAGASGTHAGVLYGFDSRLGNVSGVVIFKR